MGGAASVDEGSRLSGRAPAPVAALAGTVAGREVAHAVFKARRRLLQAAKKGPAGPSAREPRHTVFSETLPPDVEEQVEAMLFERASNAPTKKALETMESHYLFESLTAAERVQLASLMDRRIVAAGTAVVMQGTFADECFLIERGRFGVYIDDKKVFEFSDKGVFGELALLYDATRSATVRAATSGAVWVLRRTAYRLLRGQWSLQAVHKTMNALKNVTSLAGLAHEQLHTLVEGVESKVYLAREVVAHAGQDVQGLYYVLEGELLFASDAALAAGGVLAAERAADPLADEEGDEASAPGTARGDADGVDAVEVFKADQFFGEEALMQRLLFDYHVLARTTTKCLVLTRHSLEALIGPLQPAADEAFLINALRSLTSLAKLNTHELKAMRREFKLFSYMEGDVLVEVGAPQVKFFIVRSGSVSMLGDRERDQVMLGAGDSFGIGALEAELDRADCNVVATTPTRCFVLDRSSFHNQFGSLEKVRAREERPQSRTEMGGMVKRTMNMALLPLRRCIRRGKRADVHLCVPHTGADPLVVRKVHKQHMRNELVRAHALNECSMLASFSHPLAAPLLGTGQDDAHVCFVSKFYHGGTLFSRLQQETTFSPLQTKFYTACVLTTLIALHKRQIVYRGLRPESLLLDLHGYVHLADFRFAKTVHTRTFTLCGTVEYMSPEQVLGKGHNRAQDYWALGVLIYELLCGVTPFADQETNSESQVCKFIVTKKLEFPRTLLDRVAKDLIARLLRRNPSARLGYRNGGRDIAMHSWFKDILNWSRVEKQRFFAPWQPPVKHSFDSSLWPEQPPTAAVGEPFVPQPSDAEWLAAF